MIEAWISFWLTYFIAGCFWYQDDIQKTLSDVPIGNVLKTLGINAILSLTLTPLMMLIPTMIDVPCYAVRVILLIIIGDLWFYWSHRLLHTRYLYSIHKQHHQFVISHSLAGLYAHPIEYLISNYFSMMMPFKLVSNPYPNMIWIEAALVSFNILKSHSGHDDDLYGSPYHNAHHELNNCNFGFSYITDFMFGTMKWV